MVRFRVLVWVRLRSGLGSGIGLGLWLGLGLVQPIVVMRFSALGLGRGTVYTVP